MSGCNFISKLNKLRKSSSDSIDDVDSFDGFKEYMHVVRDAEKDLKAVLRQVNVGTKKLWFFCVEVQEMESLIYCHT